MAAELCDNCGTTTTRHKPGCPAWRIPLKTLFQVRADDAFRIPVELLTPHPYVDAALTRLRYDGLIESHPGVGMVISYSRFRAELRLAHDAGLEEGASRHAGE